MALIIADRVKETATTTGTGTFTLGGAVTGFRTFNAGIGTGNTTYYCIFLDGTNEFEVGLGTYTAPDQLARDTVLASSNSGSKVNFSQGIKSVFCTQPSSKAAYLDASGNLSITTSNITEGTNLYYTDARFDTRLATKDTADLSEGTNLYYTDARARAAISVSGNAISYNSTTGVITANFEESPTFTGNVVVSGNLTVTGTTTWLDSTNTQISDKNIVLNYASGDSSANADGAGITIQDAVDASTDASLTWNATDDNFEISHGLDFGDNSKARFGAGNDLQIYHSGTDSIIKEEGTGSLYLGSNGAGVNIYNPATSEFMAKFNVNSDVKLYYDNAAKLATSQDGIDVTGHISVTGQSQAFKGVSISGTNPSVYFRDTEASNAWHVGQNGGILYFLQDTDANGAYNTISAFIDASNNFNVPNGDVGIGISTAPALQSGGSGLHIHDTNNSEIKFTNSTTGTTASDGIALVTSGSTFTINNREAGNITFGTSNTERVRIDSSGNVGIGTTSPQSKLDVRGELTLANTSATLGAESVISAVNFYNTDGSGAGPNNAAIIKALAKSSTGAGGFLTFHTSDGNETEGSNAPEVMRIHHNGNVGIGTTSPSHKLDIVGGGLEITEQETTDAIAILDSTNSNTKYFSIQGDNGECNINNPAGDLVLQRGGTTRLTCTSSGVAVNGALSKSSGSFKIDHPLKPETHHLVHSFVEGPQADNLYRGVIDLHNGKATIDLDEWFGMTPGTFLALNRDIQAFVNNADTWDLVRAKIMGSQLVIECQNPESNAEVSWLVIGERQDKEIHDSILTDDNGKIIIEPEKNIEN